MQKERFILADMECLGKQGVELMFFHPTEDGRAFVSARKVSLPDGETAVFFVPVSFPESQLFMEDHQSEIYLINDQEGLEQYGHAAYFVEEGLYQKVRAVFEKETAVSNKIGQHRTR